jgi:sugar phosphate isomerase/epimerase
MNHWEIGVMVNNLESDRLKGFGEALRQGFRVVHTSAVLEAWLTGPERAAYVAAARESGVAIDTMFIGFDGQSYANLDSIARTVGLAIPRLREHRCQIARLYSELARDLGVRALALHLGFLPGPGHGDRRSLLEAVGSLADYCRSNGQTLHFETGQESSSTLLSFIHDLDRANVGVNFDPANLLLYGTDEPLAALDRLRPYVRGVHCKDGFRPTRVGELGKEAPIGKGEVPFPALIDQLADCRYVGPLVIEREQGPTVVGDILAARKYLERLQSTDNPS